MVKNVVVDTSYYVLPYIENGSYICFYDTNLEIDCDMDVREVCELLDIPSEMEDNEIYKKLIERFYNDFRFIRIKEFPKINGLSEYGNFLFIKTMCGNEINISKLYKYFE